MMRPKTLGIVGASAVLVLGAAIGGPAIAAASGSAEPEIVAPVASQVPGTSAGSDAAITTNHTRSASCAGLNFYPTDSATTYSNTDTLRHRTFVQPFDGTGVFRCDPGLPTGAVVTKVQFTLYDNVEPGNFVDGCGLRRSGLTVAGATTADTLASVPSTGDPAPGVVRLTTTAIQFATIDNARYGYWFECRLAGQNAQIGIFGANAIFSTPVVTG